VGSTGGSEGLRARRRGDPQAYAAAKAGLLGLTHAQAVSLAHKIRVNAIVPGWISTSEDADDLSSQDKDWHLVGESPRPALPPLIFW
jgi:NAD(P)-dependent dehydrogenase (short-subunit alcohol dehydrogenase family)